MSSYTYNKNNIRPQPETREIKPLLCCVIVILAGCVAPANAQGRNSERVYSVKPQPLYSALAEFAEKSGIQFVYDAALVKGLSSPGIGSARNNNQALSQLLQNSKLNYQFTDPNTVVLYRPEKPTTAIDGNNAYLLPVVQVTSDAEAAKGETLPKVTVEADAGNPYDDPAWTNDPRNSDYNRPNAVTATKTDTPLMQTPLSVKVVPSQVLKDQQVITVDQALRNVSGVVSGAGGTGTFFIRGFGNYNLYRDGFLNQSQWAHTEDLENIERVEVLKGPGSILYGRTEPGGLVNFVTKQPLDMPYYSLRQQFGSFDHYRTSIDATGPLTTNKGLGYRFNLGYQTNRTFQEFGGDERLMVAPTLRWKISDQTTSTLRVEYSDIQEKGRGRVPLLGNRPAPIPRSQNLGDPWNLQEEEYVMVSLNTEHSFNENWKLRHRFNFTDYTLTMSGSNGGSVDPSTGDVIDSAL